MDMLTFWGKLLYVIETNILSHNLYQGITIWYTINRFISEQCPLTLTIQDNVGRTALHYAAALNDNGETYGILEEYGADPNKEDEVRRTWILSDHISLFY